MKYWERKCRVCGCTWNNACPGGCYWVELDLCSTCVEKGARRLITHDEACRMIASKLVSIDTKYPQGVEGPWPFDIDAVRSILVGYAAAKSIIEMLLWLAIDADGNSLCKHACFFSSENGECTSPDDMCTPTWRGSGQGGGKFICGTDLASGPDYTGYDDGQFEPNPQYNSLEPVLLGVKADVIIVDDSYGEDRSGGEG